MEDDFYASIKLKTGEEIFARVLPCDEENKITLIVTNPIMITSVRGRGDSSGYKIEPWMKTTTEDMFVIKMDDIITMSETSDIEIIMIHQSFVQRIDDMKNQRPNISRKMGYLSNVNDAKELLEKIFKNS
jgi:predicted RNA-binding protein with RPS1 domain